MNIFNSFSSKLININNNYISDLSYAPVVKFNFENNLVNRGSGTNITLGSSSCTFSNIAPIRGIYSGSNVWINFTLKNATFPITISFWMRTPYATGCMGLLYIGNNMYIALNGSGAYGDNTDGFGTSLLTFYTSGPSVTPTRYYTTNGYGSNSSMTTGASYTVNAWNHICWIADTGSSWRIFVNGTKYTINASLYPITLTSNMACNIGEGRRNWYTGNGDLDNFYLYNGYALSDADVNQLYINTTK